MATCPNAELAAKHLINLPTHPKVKVSDAEKLFAVISNLVSVPVSKDKRL
jgi:dTDP-4-amino-4,6-dideoxygalactose transaminase